MHPRQPGQLVEMAVTVEEDQIVLEDERGDP